MKVSGLLFECLFEIVDGGSRYQFTEPAVTLARVDSGPELPLDGILFRLSSVGRITRCPTVHHVHEGKV